MEQYQSQEITKLAKALLDVQRVLQPAVKDALNPFAKNRYASLNSIMDVCREPLLDNGIWLCQYPVPVGNGGSYGRADGNGDTRSAYAEQQGYPPQSHSLGLVTKLTHAESGQWQASLAVVPLSKADPQGMGSAITYARRYALSAMLGIVTEDDFDGENNSQANNSYGYSNQNKGQRRQAPQKPSQSPVRQKEVKTIHGTETGISPQGVPVNDASRGNASANANHSSRGQQIQIPPNQTQQNQGQEPHAQQDQNQPKLPLLNGVVYDSLEAKDDTGTLREVITATGNTIPNKSALMKVGFRWNPNKKVWWKYADAA